MNHSKLNSTGPRQWLTSRQLVALESVEASDRQCQLIPTTTSKRLCLAWTVTLVGRWARQECHFSLKEATLQPIFALLRNLLCCKFLLEPSISLRNSTKTFTIDVFFKIYNTLMINPQVSLYALCLLSIVFGLGSSMSIDIVTSVSTVSAISNYTFTM